MKAKSTILSALFFLFALNLWSQEQFVQTNFPVYNAALSADKTHIAFVDQEQVYVIRTSDFSLVKQWKYEIQKVGFVSSIFFSPGNNRQLYIRYSSFNHQYNSWDGEAYPRDSIFGYDLTVGKKGALPGNAFIAPGKDVNTFLIGYNNIQPYGCYEKDALEKPCYYAQKGAIGVSPSQQQAPATDIIMSVVMSPTDSLAAFVYYDSVMKPGKRGYAIELREFPSLKIKTRRTGFEEKPVNLQFSANGRYLYMEHSFLSGNTSFILETNDLSEAKTISTPIDIPAYASNGIVVKRKGFQLVGINLASGKQEWELWSNLSNLFSFDGFLMLNEKEIVVFGRTQKNGTADGKGGIQKLNLSDLELYSGMAKEFETDTLFDFHAIEVQDNQLYRDQYRSGINSAFVPDNKGEILFHPNGKVLQLWDIKDKQKLHEYSFENEIVVFPDRVGEYVLVMEKYQKKNFDDLRIHNINMQTGIMHTKTIVDESYERLDYSNCGCVASAVEKNAWICYNGYPYHWLVKGSDFSITKLAGVKDENYRWSSQHLQTVHQANKYLYYQKNRQATDEEKGQPFLFDITTALSTPLEIKGEWKTVFLVDDNTVAYVRDKKLILQDLRDGQAREYGNADQRIIREVTRFRDKTCLITIDPNKSDSLVLYLAEEGKSTPLVFKMPHYSRHHTLLKDQLIYEDDNRIIAYDWNLKTHIPWAQTEEHSLGRPIVFDGEKYLLHEYGNIIDLSTLKLTEGILPTWSRANLLRGKMAGHLIYLETHNLWSDEKPYIEINIAPVNQYKTPVWKSGHLLLDKNEAEPNATVISDDGNYALVFRENEYAGNASPVYLLDLNSKKVTKLTRQKIRAVYFSGQLQSATVCNTDGEILTFDLADGKRKKSAKIHYPSVPEKPGYTFVISSRNVSWCKITGDTILQVKDYYARNRLNTAKWLDGPKLLAAGGDDGNLYLWKEEKQSPMAIIRCGFESINNIYLKDNNLMVLAGNTVSFVDLHTLKVKLTLNLVPKPKGIAATWYTPTGFFSAAKKDIAGLHMVKGLKAYPVLSYELFLNRPDTILAETGYAQKETIGLFKSAFYKRLKKSGYKNITDIMQVQKPGISILNKHKIPAVTSTNKISIDVKAYATHNDIDRVHIYVNGVVVYGSDGIKATGGKEFTLSRDIDLMTGPNQVSVVSVNSKGVESVEDALNITCTNENKGKIIYIGIGVSRYSNARFNLEYAAKDAQDMAESFKRHFPDAVTHILTDSMVTVQHIRSLKKEVLSKTTANDLVVISLSGHGIINQDLDFYYATHDIDFNEPEKKGLLYSEIEWLLDGIPALRKLVLVDACHSGELDKEEVELMAAETSTQQGVKFRDAGANTARKKVGMVSVAGITAELFNDLRKGTGATVISSSGGVEYSMESGQWKNGLFTYCLLYGLETGEADTDHNGQVMVGELTGYLQQKVVEMSKGRQQPTSRTQNINLDFRIW